jgi:hypothetical protein
MRPQKVVGMASTDLIVLGIDWTSYTSIYDKLLSVAPVEKSLLDFLGSRGASLCSLKELNSA